MPDLTWNKSYWDGGYDWKGRGEEWSDAWGGSEAQWFGSLYPRLHRFLPADGILEIAPGYGRWTKFLLQHSLGHYCGVDMSRECIGYCQEVFNTAPSASFYVNDGLNLDAAKDNAFQFVFSFDSLVHAELDVHEVYVPQILRKLKETGVAFIHHSNWAAAGETKKNTHCRGETVSADAFSEIVSKNGGHVLVQECLNWGTDKLIDAVTLFGRKADYPHSRTVRIENRSFMAEANILRDVQSKYCV
jgi:SAM-dependent methyltransferase